MSPVTIDMRQQLKIKGFSYTPIAQVGGEGIITKCRIHVSKDGSDWQVVADAKEFENIANNPISQSVMFTETMEARSIKLEPLETTDNNGTYTIAEFGAIIK